MNHSIKACAVAAVAGGAVLTTAGPARAYDCSTLQNVVYVAGSTASRPLLISLAKKLGNTVSILYAKPASCAGLNDVTAPAQETGSFVYIDSMGGLNTCGVEGGLFGPISVDVGVSDVFPSSCVMPTITLDTTKQKDWVGAIQPMEIVVPYTSSENSISADAAYTVFGFAAGTYMGTSYVVMPWNDPTSIFTRDATSGTQVMVANAIGLGAAKWLSTLTGAAQKAQQAPDSQTMASDIINALKPNQAIGILSAGTADPARGAQSAADAGAQTGLKPLAFQATNQDCGYYADSSSTTFDKINVRQGRYDIWGPIHFVTNIDATTKMPIASPGGASNSPPSSTTAVQALINAVTHTGLSSTSTPTLQDVIDAEIGAHFVPDCAMQVTRAGEIGAEASYQPAGACGCYYESKVSGAPVSTYCQACNVANGDADCADAGVFTHCNFGYCEAK